MRTAWLLVMALFAGGTVHAQSPLRQRISVTYQGATAPSVFHALAEVLGVRLQLDVRVTGAVTLDVRRVSVETVLRAVCESIGCRWRLETDTLFVDPDTSAGTKGQDDPLSGVTVRDVHQDIPVDIRWSDAPAEAAIGALARMLGANPVIDPDLARTRISLSLSKASASTALNALCDQAKCRWRLIDGPKRILRVIQAPPARPAGAEETAAARFAPGIARAADPGVTPPRLSSAVHPRYTDEARRAGIQGNVTIECVVERDGTVGAARIVRSLDATYRPGRSGAHGGEALSVRAGHPGWPAGAGRGHHRHVLLGAVDTWGADPGRIGTPG